MYVIARAVAARCRSSREKIPHVQGQEGGPEEIPHVQDKRNPSKTVGAARGLQRTETIITETISLNP